MKIIKNIKVLPKKLAELLGLSEREVRRLAEDGILKKIDVGIYDLNGSIKGYVNYVKDKNSNIDEGLKDAKKRKLEIEIKKMEEELIPIAEVEEFQGQLITTIRSKLLSLPKRLMADLKNIDDPVEREEIIKKSIYIILEDLSEVSRE